MATPRGIRNNNPGNIRFSKTTKWQGLADPPSDGSFCRFVRPEAGIRAMAVLLTNYNKKYGLNTVDGIIHRWAPPNENITSAYVTAVCTHLQCDPDTELPISQDRALLKELIKAIVIHENGPGPFDGDWYQDYVYEQGLNMVRPVTLTSKTIRGAAVTGLGLLGGVYEAAQEAVPQAIDTASSVAYIWPDIAKWLVVGISVLGIVMIVSARFKDRDEGLK